MELEDISQYLPQYLSADDQTALAAALNDFRNASYYTQRRPMDILQGDCWTDAFIIFNFATGARDVVKGIILSNSCDIDTSNKRDVPPKLVFAPIVSLDRYERMLLAKGVDKEKVASKLESIRSQKVTSIFYLPRTGVLDADQIVLLDDLHCMPRDAFVTKTERAKVFTLSQMGFYLFLFKISVHFCRFGEGLARA